MSLDHTIKALDISLDVVRIIRLKSLDVVRIIRSKLDMLLDYRIIAINMLELTANDYIDIDSSLEATQVIDDNEILDAGYN